MSDDMIYWPYAQDPGELLDRVGELEGKLKECTRMVNGYMEAESNYNARIAELEAEIKRLHKCIAREWVGK